MWPSSRRTFGRVVSASRHPRTREGSADRGNPRGRGDRCGAPPSRARAAPADRTRRRPRGAPDRPERRDPGRARRRRAPPNPAERSRAPRRPRAPSGTAGPEQRGGQPEHDALSRLPIGGAEDEQRERQAEGAFAGRERQQQRRAEQREAREAGRISRREMPEIMRCAGREAQRHEDQQESGPRHRTDASTKSAEPRTRTDASDARESRAGRRTSSAARPSALRPGASALSASACAPWQSGASITAACARDKRIAAERPAQRGACSRVEAPDPSFERGSPGARHALLRRRDRVGPADQQRGIGRLRRRDRARSARLERDGLWPRGLREFFGQRGGAPNVRANNMPPRASAQRAKQVPRQALRPRMPRETAPRRP